jgi:hypothetical protein
MKLTLPLAALGTLISVVFGAGATYALTKSQLSEASVRLDHIELDQGQRTAELARMGQQLNDVAETVRRIERKMDNDRH